MPISKIKGNAINDDAINSARLDENLEFTGTEAVRIPQGTTAQRASAQSGDIRFNSTLNLMEYYDGTIWKAIDSPPVISSVSPDNFDTAGDTITITGSNFQSGATIKIVNNSGTELSASTVTYTNSSTMSFEITSAMVSDDNDPYDVVVTNPSGLNGTIADALDFAPEPAFNVASGSLGTIYDSSRSGINISTGATTSESDATITYAVTSGSLPSGLSISSSTGAITGTASAVGTDTLSSFVITATATDGSGNVTTNTRSYTINVKAPVTQVFTYTGSTQTWTVPTGVNSATVKVWGAAGGGGTSYHNHSGGAGGYGYATVDTSSFVGTSMAVVVGQGGLGTGTGDRATYGHLLPSTDGLNGGFGACSGGGGGLSGLFVDSSFSQSDAIIVAGGGGGSGQNSGAEANAIGGAGGGVNQNGQDGVDSPDGTGAHGRGGTLSAGGARGQSFYTNSNTTFFDSTNGSELCGGHSTTGCNWSESGGGGSGYWGGGPGGHGSTSGYWDAGGGGSGYANSTYCSGIVGATGNYKTIASAATSDSNYGGNAGQPIAGSAGNNGRVVIIY